MEQGPRYSQNQTNHSECKAINIYLFSNGQEYCPPRKYHLSYEDLSGWKATLKYLARLQYGSMHSNIQIFTLNGDKISSPADLCDGAAYVAVIVPDKFVDTGYQKYLIKATRSWEKRQQRRQETLSCTRADNSLLVPPIDNSGHVNDTHKTEGLCDNLQSLKNDSNSHCLKKKSVTLPSTSGITKDNISRLVSNPRRKCPRYSTSPPKARSAIKKECSNNCTLKAQNDNSVKGSYEEKLNKIQDKAELKHKIRISHKMPKNRRQDNMHIEDYHTKALKMDTDRPNYKKVIALASASSKKNSHDMQLPKNIGGTNKRPSDVESNAQKLVNEILYRDEFAFSIEAFNCNCSNKDATMSTTNRDTNDKNNTQNTTYPTICENPSTEIQSTIVITNNYEKTDGEHLNKTNDLNADTNTKLNDVMAKDDKALNNPSKLNPDERVNSENDNQVKSINLEIDNENKSKYMCIKTAQSSRTVSTTSANSSKPFLAVSNKGNVVKLKFNIEMYCKKKSISPDVEKFEKGSQAHLKIVISKNLLQCNENTDTMLDAIENMKPQNDKNMASNYPGIVVVSCSCAAATTKDNNGAPVSACVSKESKQYYVLVPATTINNNRCNCDDIRSTETKLRTTASIESVMKTEIMTVNELEKSDEENNLDSLSVQQRVANIEKSIRKEVVISLSSSKSSVRETDSPREINKCCPCLPDDGRSTSKNNGKKSECPRLNTEPMTSTCKLRPHSESLRELTNIQRTCSNEPYSQEPNPCDSKRDSAIPSKGCSNYNTIITLNNEASQTEWCDTIVSTKSIIYF